MQRNLDICPVLAAHSRTRAGIWAGLDALARCFVCDGEEAFGFGETGQDPGDAKSVAAYVPIAPASANLGHQMDSAVSPVSGARWGGFGGSVVEIMARGRGKEIKRQEQKGEAVQALQSPQQSSEWESARARACAGGNWGPIRTVTRGYKYCRRKYSKREGAVAGLG
ncbi:hypothetical protein Trihar35433_4713 [Trichoderma harzianum]|nr:hypothetical protein Trihar35433_4713 [Trichoderma harzianum]